MSELANLNANRDPQLYLLQSLDPEALLTRLLGLLDGFVGAALRASDLPGWQVGHRTRTHQHLSVRCDGEDVAELILYSDRTTATPGNILPIAGMAIAHSVRLARAELAAHTDPLTGLANRRALQPLLLRCQPQAAVMLDLDHFKQVNDQFGHAAGDQLLTRITDRLQRHLRAGDQAFRLGGEEFLVILQSLEQDNLARAAERLRQRLCGAISLQGEWIRFSCSAGAAQGSETVQALIQKADQSLYRAKQAGRDRLITCDA